MTDPVSAAGGTQNRLPLIAGAGVGVIVLLFVITKVVGGGDDGSDDAATVPAPAPTGTTPAPVTPTSVPAGALPETFEVFSTKNPFVPLRGAATGTTGGTAGTTSGTGTTGTGTTGTGTTSTGVGTEPRRSSRVALLDVFTEAGGTVANVRVNDTVYKVSDGEVFATSFKVVSLSLADRCGRFVFGDDSFRLCRNEETLK
ncbi:MAG TPA: hypothetical protein VMZ51_00505 [Acidimicrobiales bacterium]|nr:hypothetical protein [Acidimicrobiales bacterium]